MTGIETYCQDISHNLDNWKNKPLLREIYKEFHQIIADYLVHSSSGLLIELGSGAADIREVIPRCIRTDLFPNPCIDRVENAYALSFDDESVANLILFDVFHHLRYPGTALKEFHRVLEKQGRVIIFDPCLSLLGLIVYGLWHHEPLGLGKPIQWEAPAQWNPADIDFYAAQGNAFRIFLRNTVNIHDFGWQIITVKRLCSISYIASGGYSKPQLYPYRVLPLMRRLDRILSAIPLIFSTRMLIVLEKN